jgi:periplasmic divalent cation tolerance protein
MSLISIFYIPIDTAENAKSLTRALLERRLIACANIMPVTSVYRWDGAVQEGAEFVVIAKTTVNCEAALRTAVESLHPYDVPCILSFPAQANEAFSSWVNAETKNC